MNPANPPLKLTAEAIVHHPAIVQTMHGVTQEIGSVMQPHLEAERIRYRQYLKDLENGLLAQGLTGEQYTTGLKIQQERLEKAEAEMIIVAKEKRATELLIERARHQTSNLQSEALAYEEEADRMQAMIDRIQLASDGPASGQPW
ncbi:hypothetical protein FRB94_000177 [Tulasnella sp. JGI-2019a]|nr:hypothetical protein FRB94_000177 [Tulasnella sp. JGI-2019a]